MSFIREPTADVFFSSLPWRWQWRSFGSSPFLSHTDDLFPLQSRRRRRRRRRNILHRHISDSPPDRRTSQQQQRRRQMTDVNHRFSLLLLHHLTMLNLEKSQKSRSTSDQWCFHHVRSKANARIQRSFWSHGSRS